MGLLINAADVLQSHAGKSTSIPTEQGFPLWGGFGALSGLGMDKTVGQAEDGIRAILDGLSILRATGAVIGTPPAYTYAAGPIALNSAQKR